MKGGERARRLRCALYTLHTLHTLLYSLYHITYFRHRVGIIIIERRRHRRFAFGPFLPLRHESRVDDDDDDEFPLQRRHARLRIASQLLGVVAPAHRAARRPQPRTMVDDGEWDVGLNNNNDDGCRRRRSCR